MRGQLAAPAGRCDGELAKITSGGHRESECVSLTVRRAGRIGLRDQERVHRPRRPQASPVRQPRRCHRRLEQRGAAPCSAISTHSSGMSDGEVLSECGVFRSSPAVAGCNSRPCAQRTLRQYRQCHRPQAPAPTGDGCAIHFVCVIIFEKPALPTSTCSSCFEH